MFFDYDVIVVGAGPAGSTAALYASRQGLRVLLLDRARFPRDKVCGDVIPPKCLEILQDLGLLEGALRDPPPFGRATETICYTEDARLEPPRRNFAPAVVCRRVLFDNILFQAAKVTLDTREEFRITGLLEGDRGVCGVRGTSVAGERCEFTAKVVVGADGAGSIVAKKARLRGYEPLQSAVATRAYWRGRGLPAARLELHYLEDCSPGYFWLFPVGQGFFNAGVLHFPDLARKAHEGSARAIHRSLEESPRLSRRRAACDQVSAIRSWHLPLARPERTVCGDGVLLLGDAAGLIDPMIGHGIDHAMVSGRIAAAVLARVCLGTDYSVVRLTEYERQIGQAFDRPARSSLDHRERLGAAARLPDPSEVRSVVNDYWFRGQGEWILESAQA